MANRDVASPASLELLRQAVEEISGELQLTPLLTRIVAHACHLIGADDGTIGLYDPIRRVIKTAAVHQMPERELGAEMDAGRGLAGKVLETGEPFMGRYGDLANINLPELADNTVIGVPIRWRHDLIGLFGIGAKSPHEFTRKDVELLTLLARHAAIAISNAQRYEHEHRRTVRFSLLARVAGIINAGLELDDMLQRAADAIHQVLEFPNVDIALVDSAHPERLVVRTRGGSFKHAIDGEDVLDSGTGIMGAAIRERSTQRVADVHSDPRYALTLDIGVPGAEVAVPMVSDSEVVGVLNVEGPDPFDELDVTSLEIVADHLALAISNARLNEASRSLAIADERQRLAYELHDSVTQTLSSMCLLTQSLASAWHRDPAEGARRTGRLHSLARMGSAEMRSLLAQLRPHEAGNMATREQSVPEKLSGIIANLVPESIRVDTDFTTYRPQRAEHEAALCRVCQEAVSNAVRHAKASRISVKLAIDEDAVTLSVRDDGCGMPAERTSTPGLGLLSIQYRMEQLQGQLRIQGRASHGIQMIARLPRQDRS